MKNFNIDLLTFSIELADMMQGKVNNLEPFSKKYRHLLNSVNLDEKSCRKLLKKLNKETRFLNNLSRDLMEISYNALVQILDQKYKFKPNPEEFKEKYDSFLDYKRDLSTRDLIEIRVMNFVFFEFCKTKNFIHRKILGLF